MCGRREEDVERERRRKAWGRNGDDKKTIIVIIELKIKRNESKTKRKENETKKQVNQKQMMECKISKKRRSLAHVTFAATRGASDLLMTDTQGAVEHVDGSFTAQDAGAIALGAGDEAGVVARGARLQERRIFAIQCYGAHEVVNVVLYLHELEVVGRLRSHAPYGTSHDVAP